MRVRSTVKGAFDDECRWGLTYPSQNQNTVTWAGEREEKSITDVVTPGFHSLQKCGKFLPLNPVTIVTENVSKVAGEGQITGRWKSTGDLYQIYGGAYCPDPVWSLPLPDPSQNLINAAVTAARANAAESEWDVLTFLAEIRETTQTLAGLARVFNARTVDMAYEARRQGRRLKRNPWEMFRELWLWGRFGVRPIAYDIVSIANALSNQLVAGDLVRGRGKQVDSASDVSTWSVDGGNTDTFYVEKLDWTRTYRGVSYIELRSDSEAKFGTDIVTTLWEVTPYSFVVDYFVNIGMWVQTLGPMLQGRYEATGYSIKTEVSRELEMTQFAKDQASWAWTGSFGPAKNKLVREEYVRGPFSGLPPPSWDPRLTLPRLIDLAALFIGGRRNVNKIMGRR